MPTIQPLSADLVAHLKTVRLSALQDTPTAFGRTYAEESLFSDADWLARVATWHSDRACCYLAMDEDQPCGMIAGFLDQQDPQQAHVASMWVAPAHRRTGLGSVLMKAVEDWAICRKTRELRLMVTAGNDAAVLFYERLGFGATGTTEPYRNDPALVIREMAKPLPAA